MIKVGIIDNNAHTREAIKRILVTHTLGGTAIPITILFDLEYCNLTRRRNLQFLMCCCSILNTKIP